MNAKNRVAIAIVFIVAAVILISTLLQKEKSEPSLALPPPVTPTLILEEPSTPTVRNAPPTPTPTTAELSKESTGSIFETVDPSLVNDSILQEKVNHETIHRYRVLNINIDQLRSKLISNGEAQDLYLPLFDDLTIMGKPSEAIEYYEGKNAGFATWRGTINGDGRSLMNVVVGPDGYALIDIVGAHGTYAISRLSDTPFHLLLEFEHTEFSFANDTGPPVPPPSQKPDGH